MNFKYELIDINHSFTKEDLLKNKSVTSAIFLLDQKSDLLEFLDRIKSIVLFFDSLTESQLKIIKNWLRNTLEDKLFEQVTTILEHDKEEVAEVVAANAFIYSEAMKKKADEGKVQGKIEGKIDDIIEELEDKKINIKGIKTRLEEIKDLDILKELYKYVKTIDNVEQLEKRLNEVIVKDK